MFDSRTDKPMRRGTHRHMPKIDRLGCYCCTSLERKKPEVDASTEITEGLLAHLDENMSAQPIMDCEFDLTDSNYNDEAPEVGDTLSALFAPVEAVSEWEFDLLTCGDRTYGTYSDYLAEHEAAHWVEDLGYEPGGWRYQEDEDDYYPTYPGDWMPHVSIEECREVFGGSDFKVTTRP